MAPMTQGKNGEALVGRLWRELMNELSFANVDGIRQAAKG